jgi:phage-related protein
MPALMRAVYYRAPDGREPVDEFINALSVPCQVLIDNQVNLLNRLTTSSPPLVFPHSSQVADELRELRCHCGSDLYRIFYQRSRNLFILLHAIRKNTGPLPRNEIAIAQQRWDDFSARMAAQPRVPPRAGGRDAP